jgi:hypothetical protein
MLAKSKWSVKTEGRWSVTDDVDAFLGEVIPLLQAEVLALQNGDANPQKALWAHDEGVTLFGAEATADGWEHVEPIFDRSPWVSPTVSPVPMRCSAPAFPQSSATWPRSSVRWSALAEQNRRP